MVAVSTTVDADADELAARLAPRTDLLVEAAPTVERGDGATVHTFAQHHGPFARYERRVRVRERADGTHEIDQDVDYELHIGPWGWFFGPAVRRRLRRAGSASKPFWAPPEVVDARGAAVLSMLAGLSLVAGYSGTLLTQTLTYAADEFDGSEADQSNLLAAVRIGILLAMVIAAWADRNGRRRALLGCAIGTLAFGALGGLAPSMWALGGTQLIARGLSTALALLIVVVAAEEMPAGSRAYGVSLLSLAGGLGAGQVLWLLPIVDVDERAWRIIFLLQLVFLPMLRGLRRDLPESKRFTRVHAQARWRGHGRRLALLSFTSFFLAMFSTPASQLQNEYLREEFAFSAFTISAFTMLTVTLATIGVVAGGRLADQRGKRLIGGIGLGFGAAFTAVQYLTGSVAVVWLASLIGSIVGGLAVPALAVYSPELFPTSLRSKAKVIITTVGVVGSVVGLLIVGQLSETWSLGPAIASMVVGPILVVAFLIPRYPETAQRELEDLNPEDATIVPFG